MKLFVLFLLLLGLSTGYVVLAYEKYGASWDEIDQIKTGAITFDYYTEGLSNYKLINDMDYRPLLTRGLIPEAYAVMFMKIWGEENIDIYHLAWGILVIPLLISLPITTYLFTYSFSWSLFTFGSILAFGRLTGNIFDNSKDIAPAVFLSLIILYFSALMKIKKIKFIYIIGLALILGSFASLRLGLFLLLAPLFGYYIYKTCGLKNLLLCTFLAIPAWIWQSPGLHADFVNNFTTSIKLFLKYREVGLVFFENNYLMSDSLPWYYLPKYLLITVPEFLIIGIIVSLFKNRLPIVVGISKNILIWSIGLAVISRPNLYDGWRHFLYLAPTLIILGVFGIYNLRKRIYIITPFFLSALMISFSLRPYEYSYFNLLAGGYERASRNYETEYWGGSFKEASEWLNKQPLNIPVYSCVPHLTKLYLNKEIHFLDKKPDNTQYLYTCYNRLQKYNYIEGKTLYKIERYGVSMHEIKLVN